jgi:PAS domain S-box-containing protein
MGTRMALQVVAVSRLRRYALPMAACLVAVAATFVLAHTLRERERGFIRQVTAHVAASVRADIEADLEARFLSPVRHADLWTVTPGMPRDRWREKAQVFLSEHPAFRMVGWAGAGGERRALPAYPALLTDIGIHDLLGAHATPSSRERSGVREPFFLPALQLPDGSRLRPVALPVFRGDTLLGIGIAAFAEAEALGRLLEDVRALRHAFVILEDGRQPYRLPESPGDPPQAWAQNAEIRLAGIVWRALVWPNPELLEERQSPLGQIVLVMGLALGVFVALTSHFQLRAQERTTQLAAANTMLEQEIGERRHTEDRLRDSESRLRAILDNCTAAIWMKDVAGRYMLINPWCETIFGRKSGDAVGKTDHDIFPEPTASVLRDNDRQVLQAGSPLEFEEAVAHPDGTPHTYIAVKFPLRDSTGQPYAICGIATDITRQKQSEALLRDLSGRLMQVQDEERRRLARELHEGTAQMLVALAMNLGMARKYAGREGSKVRSAIEASLELVQESGSQVQTMAYLLHPLGLDDFGLASALPWYAEGFSTRSGIKVSVSVSSSRERLERELELAIFRMVQEGLTNILRHSGSQTAEISLRDDESEIVLEIADKGRGISREVLSRMTSGLPVPGIGLAGMRERARQLGGRLDIESSPQGVRLVARIPARRRPGGTAAA